MPDGQENLVTHENLPSRITNSVVVVDGGDGCPGNTHNFPKGTAIAIREGINRAVPKLKHVEHWIECQWQGFVQASGYGHFKRPERADVGGAVKSGADNKMSAPQLSEDEVLHLLQVARQDAAGGNGRFLEPKDPSGVALLLAPPPGADDLALFDILNTAFSPRENSDDRLLLAVARALAQRFGRPDHMPLTTLCAWQMLNPAVFIDEFAEALAGICDFILHWQSEQHEFLILEFPETQLIQHFFESLHPRQHGVLLLKVMQFKVLSNQRLGLIRRIPGRVERFVQKFGTDQPEMVMDLVRDSLLLLNHLADPKGFPPIVSEANKAVARLRDMGGKLSSGAGAEAGAVGTAIGNSVPHLAIGKPAPAQGPAPQVSVPALPAKIAEKSSLPLNARIEAVLAILKGGSKDQIAASSGASPEQLQLWTEVFVEAGVSALTEYKRS